MTTTIKMEVSPVAEEKLKEALSSQNLQEHAVRIVAKRASPVRFRYNLGVEPMDQGREDDYSLDAGGTELRADPETAEILDGVTLDYVEDSDEGSGFKFRNPLEEKGWEDPVAQRFQELLDKEINPGIASHGGFIDLVDYKDGKAFVSMGGGCQGCGMAKVTLQEGVEARVNELIPEIKEIVDITDHAAGPNPHQDQGTSQP